MPRLAALGACAAALAAAAWVAIDPAQAGLPLLLAATGLLVAGAAWLETGPNASKEIALVATLAALASNFFLGQGPWTPWQMLAWGACGVAGAVLSRAIRGRIPFAALCFVLGFAFSALMDVWLWVSFWPHTWQAFTVVFAQGVWFDMAHAVGNVMIALAIGPELRRLLERYARRMRTDVVWA